MCVSGREPQPSKTVKTDAKRPFKHESTSAPIDLRLHGARKPNTTGLIVLTMEEMSQNRDSL